MPRGLSDVQQIDIRKRVICPAYFLALSLASGTVRFWTGAGPADVDGVTWAGAGEFGDIEGVEGSRSLRASAITVSLIGLPASAIPNGLISELRQEKYQFRPLTVFFGTCDVDTGAPKSGLVAVWTGFADVLSFRNGDTVSVSLSGEHMSSLLRKPNGRRMTTESHNQALGNPASPDLFFEPASRLAGAPKALLRK